MHIILVTQGVNRFSPVQIMDLYDFLQSRNISEDNINRMREEKIDSASILQMSDDDLSGFVPLYGDRLAVMNFCKDREDQSTKRKHKSKKSLMDKIRARVNAMKGNTSSSGEDDADESSLSKKLKGNKNAEKKKRKVELSCYHHDSHSYHQVRINKGGGPKSFEKGKNERMSKVFELGKELYFPKGENKIRGRVSQFKLKLTDTYFQDIDLEATIESYYNRLKMRQLKFHFCSTDVLEAADTSFDSDVTELPVILPPRQYREKSDTAVNRTPSTSCIASSDSKSTTDKSDATDLTVIISPKQYFGKSDIDMNESPSTSDNNTAKVETVEYISISPSDINAPTVWSATVPDFPSNFDIQDFSLDEDIEFGRVRTDSNTTLDSTLPYESTSIKEKKVITLRIHRGSALNDMVTFFKDPEITDAIIDAKMVLPNGKEETADGDGVLRDCFTEFWSEFYEQCTEGHNLKVPVLRHDFQLDEWTAVARIIRKGYEISGYWPISILPAIFEECIHGHIESNLIDLFVEYLSPVESHIVKTAISDFQATDQDDLLEFLDSHSCRKSVNSENILPIIVELAQLELIQQPRYIIDCFRSELRLLGRSVTPCMLQDFYQSLKPNTKNVLASLIFPDNLSNAERECVSYLKRYIKELDGEKLKAFLRFCTGADVLLNTKTTVEFIDVDGYTRSPIAHTCGRILKIPSTYESFTVFRSEFNYLLNSGI
ncbi:hypothetical protein KUTeg_014832 [Tegillarca granosa]|uniref:HECT domain-containing protein n=1 Tax=Tegillarca granosa TaxID=220873 RepID=A0ABQ9EUI8_TEGGR|nr:hypothetical protein KUTeg_014832 [Tegillarca granosa]